uniref:A disintegrin and metalloproteinase with thrombospondin motifs 7-like n=1 Tax=Gouania willdenowi TaxID=441366 RepID=A0A8C5HUC7_GOUWI
MTLTEQDLSQYEVVHPTRVDARGHFLSNFLSHNARRVQRRQASDGLDDPDRVFYKFWHGGQSLLFNLTPNAHLLAQGFLTERRFGGLNGAQIHPPQVSLCHFLGEVWDDATVQGSAAISTCDGLTGLFKLSREEFFIQPLEKSNIDTTALQAHAIYKRHAPHSSSRMIAKPLTENQTPNGTCGVKDTLHRLENIERQRERWESRQQKRRRRIRQRSISKEKWVETLVVADPKMVDHHGGKAVESYVLAVMNIVAGLFRDASIGNAINVVIVRLILLEEDEDDLKITHHADNSLNSFCKWQKKLNMKGDEHPLHHDVAVLLTRKDICTNVNVPCETLGLSHVAGMCQPHRSCSISEDTGLPLAFTVAHELGHNFGIQHDGNGNDCEPIGKRPFVMSPQLLYGTALPRWSRCSRQYITRFLDRGWGWCLDDPPMKDRLSVTSVLPGVLYSAVHQCRLQYGSASVLCDDMDNICSTLWCTVGSTCHSKLDGAVEGTTCGDNKWCYSGECVAVGFYPQSIHGGWGSWGEWSACSRTCGAGVESAERDCDDPIPKYGGRYCLGERRRHKICNTAACPHELPTFRDIQCSHFNTLPYKGNFYKWESVINRVNPCELHCRPLNEDFSEKLRDVVTDGTPCYEGNKRRDICINGICKSIGCDYMIDSSAVEDRCGVCHGNGSTCTTVKRMFKDSEGLGYVDIGLIPERAWDIRIYEVAAAGNFLALRSDNPNKYYLNGGWTIQWNGEYKAAGTVFTYERTGHLENLTSPGPTLEPLWIQLLFQETNPGVQYEYTINQNISEDNVPVYFWKYGSWTECSATCGKGVQRQIVHCLEKTTGIVEEQFCDLLSRPDDIHTSCKKDPCPAVWWVGEWQKCSQSCGSLGRTKRTVLCIRAVGVEEQKALNPRDCKHIPKPESLSSCNTHIPCPADWTTSNWSKCSSTCGSGVRHRNVSCSRNTGVACDPVKKPSAVASCYTLDCPQVGDNFAGFDQSGSGWSGKEVLNEIKPIPDVKPPSKYSPTKFQPGGENDLHNIVEENFHFHNTIENAGKSQENHIEVDDFYYDYNFINFHEDLSNDFDSNVKISDDSHVLGAQPDVQPTHNMEESTYMETTQANSPPSVYPTISNPKLFISETESPGITKAEGMKESKPTNLDDLLSEDYLIPAFTTLRPLSTTKQNSVKTNPYVNTFTLKGLDSTIVNAPNDEDSGYTHINLRVISNPSSEKTSTLPTPFLIISKSQEASDGFTLPTGNKIIPPTIQEGVTEPSPNNFLPFSIKQIPANPAFSQPTGTESTSLLPAFEIPSPDYNEVVVPLELTPSYLPPTSPESTFQPSSTLIQSATLPHFDWSATVSVSTFVQTSTPLSNTAYWIVGNWSACSTSCGLGAIWRTLVCSSGSESDCDPAERPAPAQRCYLRPCSTWRLGEWSKCSKDCEGGVKSREVQCFDLRDQRPLRPFHCRAMSTRPPTQMSCNLQPCRQWYTSSWGLCSEVCGGGEQQRIVTCPEKNQCDRELQPSNIQSCNSQPCSQWLTGSWGQCSALCGGGVQQRLIKCVDTKAETSEEVDQNQCGQDPRPQNIRKCNLQECESTNSASCSRDRLTFRFCNTLRWLGRCHLPNVRSQCCRTCNLRSRSNGSFRLQGSTR